MQFKAALYSSATLETIALAYFCEKAQYAKDLEKYLMARVLKQSPKMHIFKGNIAQMSFA